MTRTLRSLAAPALVAATLAAAVPTTGCYGSFAAARKIHAWNGHVTNSKIGNSVIMWGLIIIPVYELATLGDIFIFNPIEVFSGNNPIQ